MACSDPPRGIYLTYFIQGLILLAAASSITAGEYFLGFSAGFAFLLTMAPTLMTRNLRLCLPWEVNLFVAVSLYLHVMGHVAGYYISLAPYYDKLTHLVSSATIALIAFFIVALADRRGEVRLTIPVAVVFILITTLAAGAAWEIYEFVADEVFDTGLQHGNTDTMVDLIMDLVGAAIVAVFAAIALSRAEGQQFIRFFAELPPDVMPADVVSDPVDQVHGR
ncbi:MULTISPECIES: hypothetical protein [unclassified Methanoculleus]|uniref:hypothetical protein n=1 Tax=unclassified Methanoculleus TaxID=2619537 RepID=UPI0025DE2F17|nr:MULTISPECIES: hypothetical protein [unclassified Methanoculleus]MCK9318528.1 hypothetical protein [Methanoculleus sp.]MDD2254369.1 hypothetical protein [Methanoculleus sp.]MDD2787025.1 hypothetical protein [Methanoculleus sp.]MDD3215183.1 hypothetical protein [Methanoculleus sp.]MDD4314905.1 hypothetical protein [Methanoculleus sp.]